MTEMETLRSHVRAQRQFDQATAERAAQERQKRLTERLITVLGRGIVVSLSNLEYVDGISPLFKFCFGSLQFLIRGDYQHGNFELIPPSGSGLHFKTSEQFYRALGRFEAEAFDEDQN